MINFSANWQEYCCTSLLSSWGGHKRHPTAAHELHRDGDPQSLTPTSGMPFLCLPTKTQIINHFGKFRKGILWNSFPVKYWKHKLKDINNKLVVSVFWVPDIQRLPSLGSAQTGTATFYWGHKNKYPLKQYSKSDKYATSCTWNSWQGWIATSFQRQQPLLITTRYFLLEIHLFIFCQSMGFWTWLHPWYWELSDPGLNQSECCIFPCPHWLVKRWTCDSNNPMRGDEISRGNFGKLPLPIKHEGSENALRSEGTVGDKAK
jgi:hypothetical protein